MPDLIPLAAALHRTFNPDDCAQVHEDAVTVQHSVTDTEPWALLVDALFIAAHPRDGQLDVVQVDLAYLDALTAERDHWKQLAEIRRSVVIKAHHQLTDLRRILDQYGDEGLIRVRPLRHALRDGLPIDIDKSMDVAGVLGSSRHAQERLEAAARALDLAVRGLTLPVDVMGRVAELGEALRALEARCTCLAGVGEHPHTARGCDVVDCGCRWAPPPLAEDDPCCSGITAPRWAGSEPQEPDHDPDCPWRPVSAIPSGWDLSSPQHAVVRAAINWRNGLAEHGQVHPADAVAVMQPLAEALVAAADEPPAVAELRCRVIDGWLNIPCGFPAAATISHRGETVGICEHDKPKAIAAGYEVTPLPAGDGSP